MEMLFVTLRTLESHDHYLKIAAGPEMSFGTNYHKRMIFSCIILVNIYWLMETL